MSRPVAIITGGSSGIGFAFAQKLAKDYDLLLVARSADRLEAAALEIKRSFDTRVDILSADLSTSAGIALVVHQIANHSNLQLLVNNAGFGTVSYFWESDVEPFERMHRLHVMATLSLTHAALKNMVQKNIGGIINVASVGAFIPRAASTSYRATKAWMISFTEGIHLELKSAHSNVKIQALCPGFTESEFHSTRGVDPKSLAHPSFWHPAKYVVESSLAALERGTLFEIPGWRYKTLAAVIPRLPVRLRSFILRTESGFHRLCPGLTFSEPRKFPQKKGISADG